MHNYLNKRNTTNGRNLITDTALPRVKTGLKTVRNVQPNKAADFREWVANLDPKIPCSPKSQKCCKQVPFCEHTSTQQNAIPAGGRGSASDPTAAVLARFPGWTCSRSSSSSSNGQVFRLYLVPSSKSSASRRPSIVGNMRALQPPVFERRNSSRLDDSSRQRNVSAFSTDRQLPQTNNYTCSSSSHSLSLIHI